MAQTILPVLFEAAAEPISPAASFFQACTPLPQADAESVTKRQRRDRG